MKTITLTDEQHWLLNKFLDDLGDHMGNSSCNDLPGDIEEKFSPIGGQIAKEFAVVNNPNEPNGPDWPLPDFCMLAWLKHSINK